MPMIYSITVEESRLFNQLLVKMDVSENAKTISLYFSAATLGMPGWDAELGRLRKVFISAGFPDFNPTNHESYHQDSESIALEVGGTFPHVHIAYNSPTHRGGPAPFTAEAFSRVLEILTRPLQIKGSIYYLLPPGLSEIIVSSFNTHFSDLDSCGPSETKRTVPADLRQNLK